MTSPNIIAARWCYSELKSTRFREQYIRKGIVTSDIVKKARNDTPFEDLSESDVVILECALSKDEDRGPCFYPALMNYKNYTLNQWTIDELNQTIMVPFYGLREFHEFARNPPQHLRQILDQINSYDFNSVEPIISIPRDGKNMILEGTLRSLIFNKFRNDIKLIDVWYPS